VKRFAGVIVALMCAGCATYQPLPLATQALAPDNPASIKVDASSLALPILHPHVFDPGRGLDMTDIAMLAVANNPQLKLARDDRGIASAQAFAAGLLPDPVLDFSRGFPTSGPSASTAYSVGLSESLSALLTHSIGKRATHAAAREVDLNLLWQEWQLVGTARQLFLRSCYQQKMLDLLRHEQALVEQHHAELLEAQQHGDVSRAWVNADQLTMQSVQTRRADMELKQLATRQALNALLGLSPQAHLQLAGPATIPKISTAEITRDLAALPQRRPDLRALQAGYASQDARYRQAIWQQFPAINVGFVQARDADAISTRGFQLSITLPIFNRNRGNIAIEKATRQKLHDAYAIRLAKAHADVEHILQDQQWLDRQHEQLARSVATASKAFEDLGTTSLRGDLSGTEELKLKTACLDRRIQLLAIDLAMLEQQAALKTLLGSS
jgi:outer membrane protein TolC